jgi:hypothetical protein
VCGGLIIVGYPMEEEVEGGFCCARGGCRRGGELVGEEVEGRCAE